TGVSVTSIGGGGVSRIEASGRVMTLGVEADGIHVVNLAGSDAASGAVVINANAEVLVTGEGSTAIYAESSAQQPGDIYVAINGEQVIGGTGNGSGVQFVAGASNSLVNHGMIATADLLEGMAILGSTGSEIVDNYDTVIGNVNLGEGQNAFNNHQDAMMFVGRTVHIGAGNDFTNAGQISLGGANNLLTTDLTGNIVQTSTGTSFVDLDFDGNQADLVQASGIADFSGTVELNTLNPASLLPGTHNVAIVTAEDGVVDSGTALVVQPSAVVGYQLVTPDPRTLAVGLEIDFSPAGLSYNEGRVGDLFNTMQLAGGSEAMAPYVVKLFYHPDVESLALTYDALVPDYYDHFTRTTLEVVQQSSQPLLKRMQSVRMAGKMPVTVGYLSSNLTLLAYNGSDAGLSQLIDKDVHKTNGMWVVATGVRGDQDSDDDFDGFDYYSYGVTAGLDTMLNSNALVGMSLGYFQADLDVDDNQGSGDFDTLSASIYGSYFTDRFYLDGVLSYGQHDYDNHRKYEVFSAPRQVHSDHDGTSWSIYGESGYSVNWEEWIVQPFAALHYVYLDEDGFEESGAGALSLIVKSRSTESLVSDLGARLLRGFETSSGLVMPELSASWNYNFGIDDRMLSSSFAGYPGAEFSIKGREEEESGLILGAGLNFLGKSGVSSSLKYREEFRDGYTVHGIMGEVRMEF
ncbi:MAG: autotransporter domain-containing protein, partial [Desulfuromonadales bacterium]|nr:autotransporter domain-containing protein [Desulfuromonadales bacterium]